MTPARDVADSTPQPALFVQGLAALRSRGPRNALEVSRDHLRARWAFRHATRVGTARLWGRAHILNQGTMLIGDHTRFDGRSVRLDISCSSGATLSIGDGTYINYGSNISATERVTIGNNCAIGQYAIIMDNDYHDLGERWKMGEPAPIVIEDDVWLGARVIVLRGAHIGRGSVIGANSVVKGCIPAYTLAAGMPARIIRSLR